MGGPHALLELLGSLPRSFPLPILIAQHISVGFAEGLARWLDTSVPLPVQIGRAGVTVARGVWLAPDDAHMLLERGRNARAASRGTAPTATCRRATCCCTASPRPSVATPSPSSSRAWAATEPTGTAAVSAAGGFTIAQDEATSVVYGMPRAAAEGGVDRVLPLTEIGAELCNLTLQGRRAMSPHLDAIAEVIRGAAGLRFEQSRHHALRAALARAWPGVPHAEVLRRALDPVTGPGNGREADRRGHDQGDLVPARPPPARVDRLARPLRPRARGRVGCRARLERRLRDRRGAVFARAARVLRRSRPARRPCASSRPTSPPPHSPPRLPGATASAPCRVSRSRCDPAIWSGSETELVVTPALRQLVALAPHNLVADAYPPPGEAPVPPDPVPQRADLLRQRDVRARRRRTRAGARPRRAPRARRSGRPLRARARSGRAAPPTREAESLQAAPRAAPAAGSARGTRTGPGAAGQTRIS